VQAEAQEANTDSDSYLIKPICFSYYQIGCSDKVFEPSDRLSETIRSSDLLSKRQFKLTERLNDKLLTQTIKAGKQNTQPISCYKYSIRRQGFSRLTGQQGTTGSAVKATQEDDERVGFPAQSAGTGKLVFASCIALKHV
jgi:hypothetical protein